MKKSFIKGLLSAMAAVSILTATVTPAFANDEYTYEASAYVETVEYTNKSEEYTEEAVGYTEEAAPAYYEEAAEYTGEAAEYTGEAASAEETAEYTGETASAEETAEYTGEAASAEETAEYTEVSTPVDETAAEETSAEESVSAEEEAAAEETVPAEEASEEAVPDEDVIAEDQPADPELTDAFGQEDAAGLETEMAKADDDAEALTAEADSADASDLPKTEEDIRNIIKNTDPTKKEEKYEDIHSPGAKEEEKEDKSGSVWKEAEKLTREIVTQGLWVLSSTSTFKIGSTSLGRMAVPYWQKLFDYISGKKSDSGDPLSDISKQLEEYQGDLERHTNKILEKTEASEALRNYGNRLDVVNASVRQIIASISGNEKDEKLSKQDKLVFTARALGNVGVGESNSFLVNLDLEAQALYGGSKSDIKGRDLFQAIYDYNKYNHMFSGEVIEASQQFINECMDHYIFSYAVAMQCLDAYRQVLNFDENDKAKLSEGAKEAYRDLIKANSGIILKAMENLSKDITGLKTSDGGYAHTGIAQHLADFNNGDKFVFVNKGKAEVHLSGTMVLSDYADHSYDTLSKVLNSNPMTAKDTEDLINYINKEWKGGTVLTYLKERGFNFVMRTKDLYDKVAMSCQSGYDLEAKAGVIDKSKISVEEYTSKLIGEKAAKNAMKKSTYLAAGKQGMTKTEKKRTKSWSTIEKQLYHGYSVKKKTPEIQDCLYHNSAGTKKDKTGCVLTFQSR